MGAAAAGRSASAVTRRRCACRAGRSGRGWPDAGGQTLPEAQERCDRRHAGTRSPLIRSPVLVPHHHAPDRPAPDDPLPPGPGRQAGRGRRRTLDSGPRAGGPGPGTRQALPVAGNTFRAIDILEGLGDDSDTAYRPEADDKQRAFSKQLAELCVYIGRKQRGNSELRRAPPLRRADLHRHRRGHRQPGHQSPQVKKQQMRWSPRGAHLLL